MSTLSRVCFDPDTTPPSVPTGLSANVISASRIDLSWTASTDTGGSGLAGYDIIKDSSTTIPLGVQTSYSDTSLATASSHTYRVRARDGNGNLSAYGTQVSATTQGSTGGVVGVVGSRAALNLAANPISSIDMAANDYEIHFLNFDIPNSGTSTHNASGWPLGGAFSRMRPPTGASQDRGVAVRNLWRNATLDIQELNYRIEWRGSSEMGSRWQGSKWNVVHVGATLTNGASNDERPIIYAAQADQGTLGVRRRNNTIVFGLAMDTVQAWGPAAYATTYPPLSLFRDVVHLFYMADDADPGVGTTFNGLPIIGSSEVLTFEHRIVCKAISGFPSGLQGLRVYRQNGTIVTTCLRPYLLDDPINPGVEGHLGYHVQEIQQMGCGQYNVAPTANANLYMDVGGYITLARDLSTLRPDLNGWMGHRTNP